MNKNSIKDDELEKVNGGTRKENIDLYKAFGTFDDIQIEDILMEHGIYADLRDDQGNTYLYIKNGETVSHEELMNMIRNEHWL